MTDPVFDELSRVYSDRYDITVDQAGRIVLDPKLTAAAMRLREGSSPVAHEEFQNHFGSLPTGPY